MHDGRYPSNTAVLKRDTTWGNTFHSMLKMLQNVWYFAIFEIVQNREEVHKTRISCQFIGFQKSAKKNQQHQFIISVKLNHAIVCTNIQEAYNSNLPYPKTFKLWRTKILTLHNFCLFLVNKKIKSFQFSSNIRYGCFIAVVDLLTFWEPVTVVGRFPWPDYSG